MTLPFLPAKHHNEVVHRQRLVESTNELLKVRPPFDRSAAEVAADVLPVDHRYGLYDARRYGVVMDDESTATSNTAILNSIGAAAWPSSITLSFPDGDVWINGQVSLTGGLVGLRFSQATKFRYNGTADQPVILFSSSTATLHDVQLDMETAHDWSDADCIGFRISNTRGQHISIRRVVGFHTNVQLYGSSTNGIAFNTIHVYRSFDAVKHFAIHSTVANGFVNQNDIRLYSIDNSSSFPTDEDSYGFYVSAESGAYRNHNCNIIKASFELENGDVGTERIPVVFDNAGANNKIKECRVEGARTAIMRIVSDVFEVQQNTFEITFFDASPFASGEAMIENTDGGLGHSNCIFMPRFGGLLTPQYQSGPLVEQSFANTSARISTKGCFFQLNTDDFTEAAGVAHIGERYVYLTTVSRAIGVWVDTSVHKEFAVKVNVLGDCDVAFVCYNSSGTRLTSSDTGHPFVAASATLTYGTSFGSSYRTTSGAARHVRFRVGSTVAKIKLLFLGPTQIDSFNIVAYAMSVRAEAISVWSEYAAERLVDDSPATIRHGGYSQRGQLAFNDDAASGAASYWQCTATGWNATAWAATTAYIVDNLVENDTGKIYVCTVAGTSAGAGGPTGTGTAITDNTVTWKYIGTLATWTAGPNNP